MGYKNAIKKINYFFESLSPFWFIVVITIVSYVILIPFEYFMDTSNMGGPSALIECSLLEKIIIASIVVPLIETLIFQYSLISLTDNIKALNQRKYIGVIFSAAVFALAHNYSLIYIFYAFVIGIILGYAYVVYQKKEFSAFLMVTLIHALRNTIATILLSI